MSERVDKLVAQKTPSYDQVFALEGNKWQHRFVSIERFSWEHMYRPRVATIRFSEVELFRNMWNEKFHSGSPTSRHNTEHLKSHGDTQPEQLVTSERQHGNFCLPPKMNFRQILDPDTGSLQTSSPSPLNNALGMNLLSVGSSDWFTQG